MARQNSFALDVRAFVLKAQEAQDQVFREVVLEIARSIILMSPVDTGRFRGNWQTEVNRIPAGQLDVFDKEGGPTIAKVVNGTVALKVGDVAYIANNLPYAIELEYGHSTQAPAGMVRITVERFQSIVREAIAKHKI